MVGLWFDRTAEYRARRYGATVDPMRFASKETIRLSPLPCWKGRSPEWIRSRVQDLVAWIKAEAKVHRFVDRPAIDLESLWRRDPHYRPRHSKRSPAPICHAASVEKRQEFLEAYRNYCLGKV